MAHVLVVVARQYNGHELWTSLGILQGRGHTFEVVSKSTHLVDEVTGRRNTIARTYNEITSLDNFDALMFISGNMADTEEHWTHLHVQKLVQLAIEKDIPISAICCSVPTIRKAAKGRKVSFFPLIRSRELLRNAGAILQTVSITVDGNLVTAEHQMCTQMWAEEFCNVLEHKPVQLKLVDSKYTPKGRERKPIPAVEHIKHVTAVTSRRNVKDVDVSSK
jgi:putative intracellular protease/amidase